jgi:biotin carboxyl carrier protein
MSVEVTAGAQPGEIIVRDGARVERLFGVSAAGVTWIFHDGNVYRVEPVSVRRHGQQTHGSLSSPMPATVISVNVAPGDEVAAGQTLIVLEAMKMELPVRAPGNGRVSAVHCQAGELVQPNVSLIDFE